MICKMKFRCLIYGLRICQEGYGYGPKALRLVAEYVFGLPGKKIRLEGHTRQDNLAMRKTFERAGFVKEAHLRNAWFSPKENSYYDAVLTGLQGKTSWREQRRQLFGKMGKRHEMLQHHRVFQISRSHSNRNDLSFEP